MSANKAIKPVEQDEQTQRAYPTRPTKPTQPTFPTASELLQNYGLGPLYSNKPQYASYIGHPWTKGYDDIVPDEPLKSAKLKDLDYYADNFGLDTSVANLQKKFDTLTQQEYLQKNAAYRQSEDAYYQNMTGQNAQYQAAIQNAASQALQAGASRGMQFANQFAAQNQLAEQNSTGALDLATQRNNLRAEEAEAYTKNAINADETIRNLKTNILGQAVADRANEVQRYAADASLKASDNLSRIQNYQFNIAQELQRYIEDSRLQVEDMRSIRDYLSALEGNKIQALAQMHGYDVGFESDMYNTDVDAHTNMYNADKNLEGNKIASKANIEAAMIAAEAQKYGYDMNYKLAKETPKTTYTAPKSTYTAPKTTDEVAVPTDILNAYKTALNTEDAATQYYFESEYPWLKSAYDADLNKRADALLKSGLLKQTPAPSSTEQEFVYDPNSYPHLKKNPNYTGKSYYAP